MYDSTENTIKEKINPIIPTTNPAIPMPFKSRLNPIDPKTTAAILRSKTISTPSNVNGIKAANTTQANETMFGHESLLTMGSANSLAGTSICSEIGNAA